MISVAADVERRARQSLGRSHEAIYTTVARLAPRRLSDNIVLIARR